MDSVGQWVCWHAVQWYMRMWHWEQVRGHVVRSAAFAGNELCLLHVQYSTHSNYIASHSHKSSAVQNSFILLLMSAHEPCAQPYSFASGNRFKTWCGCLQGWGIVEFEKPEEAAAAIEQLNGSEVMLRCHWDVRCHVGHCSVGIVTDFTALCSSTAVCEG